jgi:hypothetical protein
MFLNLLRAKVLIFFELFLLKFIKRMDFLICHFGNKFNPDKPDFFFAKFAA